MTSPHQLSLSGDGNRSGLLRHHNGQSIADLADSHGRPVPCTEVLAQFHIVRQRQIAGGGHNAVAPHEDSAVVERRILLENN